MGVFGKNCSSSPYAVPNSNPNPVNFKILEEKAVGQMLVLKVQYPDATNYEGIKILVYMNFTKSEDIIFKNRGKLDPHFAGDGSVSPVARFEPTVVGMYMAIKFCHAMQVMDKKNK